MAVVGLVGGWGLLVGVGQADEAGQLALQVAAGRAVVGIVRGLHDPLLCPLLRLVACAQWGACGLPCNPSRRPITGRSGVRRPGLEPGERHPCRRGGVREAKTPTVARASASARLSGPSPLAAAFVRFRFYPRAAEA